MPYLARINSLLIVYILSNYFSIFKIRVQQYELEHTAYEQVSPMNEDTHGFLATVQGFNNCYGGCRKED